jgi:hypothetical protein
VKKLFIVRKYVMASSVAQAVRIEKRQDADDCWLDDDWKKSQPNAGADVMGFETGKRRKPHRKNG